MAIVVLAPEFGVVVAVEQWLEAGRVVRRVEGVVGEGGLGLGLVHGFYSGMGGFAVEERVGGRVGGDEKGAGGGLEGDVEDVVASGEEDGGVRRVGAIDLATYGERFLLRQISNIMYTPVSYLRPASDRHSHGPPKLTQSPRPDTQ